MLIQRLKELCSSLPRTSKIHKSLDSVVTKLFQQIEDTDFIHSQSAPQDRYGVPVDEEILHHHNDCLDGFDACGPNERYLVNKVFYSECHLLYVVGGIGVGKTTFTRYLMSQLLPKVRHSDPKLASKCPVPIYFDFLNHMAITVKGKSLEEIQQEFVNTFCTHIEARIVSEGYFNDPMHEVDVVWNSILEKPQNYSGPASSYIVKRVFEENAKTLPSDEIVRRDVLLRRVAIRAEIMKEHALRWHYVALLLNFIRDKHYSDHRHCFVIIVDNIDRDLDLAQRAVGLALKPFAKNCKVRVVVNVRQTTYYQGLGDNLSETVDLVAYCGPKPLTVINKRISDFIESPKGYEKFYSPADLPTLVKGITEIRNNFLHTERFIEFFEALTGNSVRKGLVLAQNLILNTIYDPYEVGRAGGSSNLRSTTEILRALMVGANQCYTYGYDDLIENIFEVQGHKGESPLIKLRILRILSRHNHNNGTSVNKLINILKGFGQSSDVIRDALNEMLSPFKRLMWSDSVNDFESVEEMSKLGGTRVSISSSGEGYLRTLCKKVEYIQEVMLDTFVQSSFISHFGRDYDYGKMEDRFKMVSRFCSYLVKRDMEEVEAFANDIGTAEYQKEFGSDLISRAIMEAVMHDVGSILDFVVDHTHGGTKSSRLELKKELNDYFEDWRLRLDQFEKRIFSTETDHEQLQTR